MKYRIFVPIAIVVGLAVFSGVPLAQGVESRSLLLPYATPESFVVVQGYDSPPTHIKKDTYALDFSESGCAAYGKKAVAVAGGKIMLAQPIGYNGGYGAQILIDHGDDTVTRYAHLIAGSIAVHENEIVPEGSVIGDIGDTGLVAGSACKDHPGTHLHFARYERQTDGTYTALMPEPMSGYRNLTVGSWYPARAILAEGDRSIKSSVATVPSGAAIFDSDDAVPTGGVVAGASIIMPGATDSASAVAAPVLTVFATSTRIVPFVVPQIPVFGSGGVMSSGGGSSPVLPVSPVSADSYHSDAPDTAPSSVPLGDASSTPSETSSSTLPLLLPLLAPPTPIPGSGSIAAFTTSTLTIDLTWQPPANASGGVMYAVFETTSTIITAVATDSVPFWTGTLTGVSYPIVADGTTHVFVVAACDESGATSSVTTTLTTPNWLIVAQPYDGDVSYPSWYEDTWYQLGTGFYGTIRSLTLNGYVNNPEYYASRLALNEFLDPNYVQLNQSFIISDHAPFTATSTLVAISNLNIPLQPNKYYRLDTYNDYQNRSIILRGTAATGTAMWDGFMPGTGRVENHYPFYPYLAWTFIPNWPPLAAPNPPPGAKVSFDATNLVLDLSWDATNDLDTTSTLLTYEYAVSTSTAIDGVTWQSVGKNFIAQIPVVFPDAYTVSIRSRDDLENVSVPDIISWSFPDGYVQLPSQMSHDAGWNGAPARFHLGATTTVASIGLWTSLGDSIHYRAGYDSVGIYADADGTRGDMLVSSNFAQASWPREMWHDLPSPLTLPAGDYWLAPYAAQFGGAAYYGNVNGEMYFRLRTAD